MGPDMAFGDRMRDQGIKQQLLLISNKTLNKALKQTLELEVVELTVRYSHQALQNESQGTVEELAPSQMKEKTINSLCASTVEAPATFESSVPTKLEAEASVPARR
jgi:hypothetical protein